MALLTTMLVGFGLLALSLFAMAFIAKHGCCAQGVIDALRNADTRHFGMCHTCWQIQLWERADPRPRSPIYDALHRFCWSVTWSYHPHIFDLDIWDEWF